MRSAILWLLLIVAGGCGRAYGQLWQGDLLTAEQSQRGSRPYAIRHNRVPLVDGRWAGPGLLFGSGLLLARELNLTGANDSYRMRFGGKPDQLRGVDDYIQYIPSVSYGLMMLFRVEGRSSGSERLFATLVSGATVAILASSVKATGLSIRPNGANRKSFPSGHTSFSFWGAELLRLEYAGRYPWIGPLAYGCATSVALMRVLHDKHWLGDILAGAGVGIASAWVGYLVAPMLADLLPWRVRYAIDIHLGPVPTPYSNNSTALTLEYQF